MPNDFSRIERIQDLIQVELAKIVQQEIRDPRLAMVTITSVAVSKDIKHAKVYVTVFPDSQVQESIKVLNRASGYIRTILANRVTFKNLPSLKFYFDDTTIEANRIGKLIDQAVGEKSSEEDGSDNNLE